MRNFIFFLCVTALYGCSNNTGTNNPKKSDSIFKDSNKKITDDKIQRPIDSLKNSSDKKDSTKNILLSKVPQNGENLYKYYNDTLTQNIVIKYLNKIRIHFSLESSNKKRNKTERIEGDASMPNGVQDSEEDNDENGMAYASNEFVYHENNCWLHIRIDADSTNKIQINKVKCPQMTLYCPFYSVGVLRYSSKK
jgi:hypothetical protein